MASGRKPDLKLIDHDSLPRLRLRGDSIINHFDFGWEFEPILIALRTEWVFCLLFLFLFTQRDKRLLNCVWGLFEFCVPFLLDLV